MTSIWQKLLSCVRQTFTIQNTAAGFDIRVLWQKQELWQKHPSQSVSPQFETRKCNACAVVQHPQVLMCLYYTSLNDPLCWATSISPPSDGSNAWTLLHVAGTASCLSNSCGKMSEAVACSCWWIRDPPRAHHLVNSQSVRFLHDYGFPLLPWSPEQTSRVVCVNGGGGHPTRMLS